MKTITNLRILLSFQYIFNYRTLSQLLKLIIRIKNTPTYKATRALPHRSQFDGQV